jgi:putative membrane protein
VNASRSSPDWRRTSPVAVLFYLSRLANQLGKGFAPAAVVLFAGMSSMSGSSKALAETGFIMLLVVVVVSSVLSWLRFRYRIDGDRVLVRSGVLHREELSIEFKRIQNVSIREPFYMRPFSLSLLSIDTAGSQGKEVILSGIDKTSAIELRDTILAQAVPAVDDESTDHSVASASSLLLTRGRKDIVVYGLTVNFILWVLVAAGAFFGAWETTEKLVSWISAHIRLDDVMTVITPGLGFIGRLLVMTALLIAALLMLPLISIIGAVFRHDGYRLSVEGETYRKTSGLLTKHDESLKRHKIQAMVWKQNFVARYLARTNVQLRVAQAGTGTGGGQPPTGGKASFLVPALHEHEVNTLSAEFLPGCEAEKVQFSRINRRRLAFVVLGVSLLPILPLTTGLSLLVSWKFTVLLPLALAIVWSVLNRYWKQTGYGVVGEYGFIRHGFIGAETTVFALFKVQRVDIIQSRGQRKRGLAQLRIHLASHTLNMPYIPVKDAHAFRDLALYYVESERRRWY